MRRALLLLALLTAACTTATTPTTTSTPSAAQRLENTPRHDEWVALPTPDGRTLHAYVAYPQSAEKAPAILVVHENRGLTDWVRSVADRLAENGYIAIAPDFLSGMAPNGGKTSDFPTSDAAREAISKIPPKRVETVDMPVASDYVTKLPSANGSLSVAGFCWGGGKVWQFANVRPGLAAAYVFYGTGPSDEAGVANITAPVYGFYGGSDARVNATVPKTEELMRAAGKRFEPVYYDLAGHAFMREGELPTATAANNKARDDAWKRWITLLR